jgi:antitoxin CptB
MATRVELNRLRWRCRRGLLENDLILARFLDARGEGISAAEIVALDRLLQLSDNELWDLLSGRQEPAEAAVAPLLNALRAVCAGAHTRPADGSVPDSAWSNSQ